MLALTHFPQFFILTPKSKRVDHSRTSFLCCREPKFRKITAHLLLPILTLTPASSALLRFGQRQTADFIDGQKCSLPFTLWRCHSSIRQQIPYRFRNSRLLHSNDFGILSTLHALHFHRKEVQYRHPKLRQLILRMSERNLKTVNGQDQSLV